MKIYSSWTVSFPRRLLALLAPTLRLSDDKTDQTVQEYVDHTALIPFSKCTVLLLQITFFIVFCSGAQYESSVLTHKSRPEIVDPGSSASLA